MRTAQQGDRVQVHFVKRFQDGTTVSSRIRYETPLEVTIGTNDPRLPGLGLELLGAAPGDHVTLNVPVDRAYGQIDPKRVRRLARTRFVAVDNLRVGKWVRLLDQRGRRRLVRIVEVHDRFVLVDTNHPKAGQSLEMELELLNIQAQSPDQNLRPQSTPWPDANCGG